MSVWAKTFAQEFDLLDDEANIYKQIGPVLLKQDKTEALMSVNGRLEFIDKEIRRFETQIQSIQDKSEKLKVEVRCMHCFETQLLTNHTDHTDTKRRTAAATAGPSRSIEPSHDQKQIRYPIQFDVSTEARPPQMRDYQYLQCRSQSGGPDVAGVGRGQSTYHATAPKCKYANSHTT